MSVLAVLYILHCNSIYGLPSSCPMFLYWCLTNGMLLSLRELFCMSRNTASRQTSCKTIRKIGSKIKNTPVDRPNICCCLTKSRLSTNMPPYCASLDDLASDCEYGPASHAVSRHQRNKAAVRACRCVLIRPDPLVTAEGPLNRQRSIHTV